MKLTQSFKNHLRHCGDATNLHSMGSKRATMSAKRRRAEPTKTRHQEFRWAFLGLLLSMLLAALSQTVLITALPSIAGDLDGTNHMSWILTAYLVTSTIVMPIYGKVGDLLGRKHLLLGAIALFTFGSIIGGSSSTMSWIIVGRIVQGAGGGGLITLSQTIVGEMVAERERGRYLGYLGATFGVSSIAGPALGGWFTTDLGWRWAFWLNLPLAFVAFVAVASFVPNPTRPSTKAKIDFPGIILLSIAMIGLALISTWAGMVYSWTSVPMIAAIIGTCVATGAFIFAESRAAEPIIALSLFSNRNFVLTTIASVLSGVAVFGVWNYLPSYLQMAVGTSATGSGLLLAPMMGTHIVTSVLAGRWTSRTGRYKSLPILGCALMGGSMVALWMIDVSNPLWIIGLVTSVFGAGMGLTLNTLVLIGQVSFPLRDIGTVTASSTFFRQLGGSLGTAAVGGVFAARLAQSTDSLPAAIRQSLTPAAVQELPASLQRVVAEVYNESLMPVFLAIVPLLVLSAVLLCFVVAKPLSRTTDVDASHSGSSQRLPSTL